MTLLPPYIRRSNWLLFAASVSIDCVAPALVAAAPTPIDIGSEKQLFIDKRFIEQSENVSLATNPAQKIGTVVLSGALPADHHPAFVPSVFKDGGKFKMYYGAITKGCHALAYAESTDAIHWNCPALGIVNDSGTTENNLVLNDSDGAMPEVAPVMLDEHGAPEARYKLFMGYWHSPPNAEKDGIYAFQSADGFHFTRVRRVFPLTIDSSVICQWDNRIHKYVIWTRAFVPGGSNQRQVARIEVDDPMQPWPRSSTTPDKTLLITPNDVPIVLKADDKIEPGSDIYYHNTIKYPWAQDTYLMFLTPFRHFGTSTQPWFKFEPGNDYGLIETELAVSRDGINWTRPSRQPYFEMGLADEWDRWLDDMGHGMIRRGSYLYQYYCSSGRTHDGALLRPEYKEIQRDPKEGIGITRQRLDGFMSADVDECGGWIQTPLITFQGKRLRLNVNSGAMGTAFVELRDADSKPIPGFSMAEAEEVGGNYIDQQVYWKANTDVSALAGKPVRLFFKLNRAKLFGFQFTNN